MKHGMSSWAIRHPIPVIVVFVVLAIAGLSAFLRLPVNANPRVDFPVVTVTVAQPSATPAELETLVTRKIEGAVTGIPGVRHIQSSISDGVAVTTVEFHLNVNSDRATTDVRDAVTQLRPNLPRDIQEPVVNRLDVEGGAILHYAVRAPNLSATDLSWFIDDTVSRALLSTPGVQRVTRLGGVTREINITLDPNQLAAYRITARQVNAQLQATNANVPAGRSTLYAQEQSIRTIGSASSTEALAARQIALPDGGSTALANLAVVSDGPAETRETARFNGDPAIGFAVFRARDTSDTVVEDAVKARLATLRSANPGIEIIEIASTVDYTRGSYHAAMEALLEGGLLTLVVVFVFLRDWRATLIAAVAMPLSILPTFAAMQIFGFTLNSITLLALTLVVGILVDDAIVEVENIDTHLHRGKRPYQAAIDAADAIGFAVVAITATIVAVFLPVSFIGGVVGKYFTQFGVTVAVAVLVSLAVARLVTPLMAAYLLRPKPAAGHAARSGLTRRYLWLLELALRHRHMTAGIAGALLVGSFLLLPLLPSGFIPTSDRNLSRLTIELPPGASVSDTDTAVQRITGRLLERNDVEAVFSVAGGQNSDGIAEVRRASLVIRLKPLEERGLSQKAFEREVTPLIATVPNLRFSFQAESAPRDIQIILAGENPETLNQAVQSVVGQMSAMPGLRNVQTDEPLSQTELRIVPRPAEAARLGVTTASIADMVRIATIGDIDAGLAKFNLDTRQLLIRVRIDPTARADLDQIEKLRVETGTGETVPLIAVADVSLSEGPGAINRMDRLRRITISADLDGIAVGEALERINALAAMKSLPAGVQQIAYGEAEYIEEMFTSFGLAMALGILMVLAVLVVLFRDFLQPLTILLALPLSIGGALGALLLYGGALDLPAVIGLLMLMGIVTKNSILLVDFAIEKRAGGMDRHQALIETGAERVRPIVMTTVAMAAGMVPAAIGLGEDAGFRAPMAISVIGGLITSTLLSLIVVPVAFTFMDDLRQRLGRSLVKLTSVTDADRRDALRRMRAAQGDVAHD
jgi:hydrophobe/amphiphile efflux-1 (HAE1) family protein